MQETFMSRDGRSEKLVQDKMGQAKPVLRDLQESAGPAMDKVADLTQKASTEAAAAVEAAELILLTDMREATRKLRAGEDITVVDRIRARRNQAYVTRLAVQAIEALNASTGGAGLHLSNPVQRAWRSAMLPRYRDTRGMDHVRLQVASGDDNGQPHAMSLRS
jgi:hypothetical protein